MVQLVRYPDTFAKQGTPDFLEAAHEHAQELYDLATGLAPRCVVDHDCTDPALLASDVAEHFDDAKFALASEVARNESIRRGEDAEQHLTRLEQTINRIEGVLEELVDAGDADDRAVAFMTLRDLRDDLTLTTRLGAAA